MRTHLAFVVGLAALVPGSQLLAQSGFRWTPSFDDALAAAKAERKVLMLAFNMAGERANDELVADHYKDPTLARLSLQTVNVFCSVAAEARVPGVSASQQQAAEQVQEGLAQALRDTSAKVRSTAAFALASRRDVDFAKRLDEAASNEADADTKAWLEAAAKVVRGGEAGPFKNFLERVLGETPPKNGLSRLGDGGRRG